MRRIKAVHSWLLVIAMLTVTNGFSQADYSSPYSRFGIGDLLRTTHPAQMGMGGLSIAKRDARLINYQNPAAYTAYDSLSFVFDGGARQHFSNWQSLDKSQRSEYSSLGYLTMGFPITQWLKVTTGLVPVSDVGYQINNLRNIPDIGSVEQIYEGEGGISEFFIGGGVQLSNRLSGGANASYVWGDIDLSRLTYFPDSIYYWAAKVAQKRHISDIKFSYGLQYVQPLSEEWQATAGLTYSNATELSATEQRLSTQIIRNPNGAESVHDTVSYSPDNKGSITMPASYGIGLMFEKNDRLRIGVDYRHDNWEEYKAFGNPEDSLQNSNFFAIGAELWPEHNVLSSYFRKMKYRIGFHYSDTYLNLNNTTLSEVGIGFGVGLPVQSSGSSVNLGVEIGRRGTTDNALVKENYIKFTLGISIFERWFIKRKYQ